MKAVESGEMETAQRMVDEAAKAADYDRLQYHQTASVFTVFDLNRNNNSASESLFPYGYTMD